MLQLGYILKALEQNRQHFHYELDLPEFWPLLTLDNKLSAELLRRVVANTRIHCLISYS